MKYSFYPGPSTVYKKIPDYVKEAYITGILSVNHRSPEFAEVMEETMKLLKSKLNIPKNYEIVFTSSATECWEVIAQSLLRSKSYHFYNGDFGKKWFQYTKKLVPEAEGLHFDLNDELHPGTLTVPDDTEIICITQNETSNGTQVLNKTIKAFRVKHPDKLIAIDATSSMAGIALDFKQADIWLASVQKCFGLPAGLGILICSPAAIETAFEVDGNIHYNSLVFMLDNVRKLQTHYTPNVLGIFLLMKVLEERENIVSIEEKLKIRYQDINKAILSVNNLKHLCSKEKVRSTTVLAIESNPKIIANIKTNAEEEGLILGNGYGKYSHNTFRIANFPAIPDSDFLHLAKFLKNFASSTDI
jgi:phosphoserine aminotransferase